MKGRPPIPEKTRRQVLERDGYRCTYCNWRPGRSAGFSIDHVDPHGGNEPENLTAACRDCNNRKNVFSVVLFLAKRALAGWPAQSPYIIISEPEPENGRDRWMREAGDNFLAEAWGMR